VLASPLSAVYRFLWLLCRAFAIQCMKNASLFFHALGWLFGALYDW
jgi:hypothetical protein